MLTKKDNQGKNHVVIVTSDREDASVRQFRIRSWFIQAFVAAVCIVIGAIIAYFVHEIHIWKKVEAWNMAQQETVKQLESEKTQLNYEIDELNTKIQVLSDTVNQKTQKENELNELIAKQRIPTEFPLTGSSSMETITEGDPICVFRVPESTTVIATAAGTVMAINEDETYGNNVWIDHGNGFVTIYRNQGKVCVKIGDDVAKGTTLFLIGSENTLFGYQMMKDGAYVNPIEMMEING